MRSNDASEEQVSPELGYWKNPHMTELKIDQVLKFDDIEPHRITETDWKSMTECPDFPDWTQKILSGIAGDFTVVPLHLIIYLYSV